MSTLLQQLAYCKRHFKHSSDYPLWQEGSHAEELFDQQMMRGKPDCIHNNPVKRGYIDDPSHWRYSRARNYAGDKGLIEVASDW